MAVILLNRIFNTVSIISQYVMPDILEQEVVAVIYVPETRQNRNLRTLPPATKYVIPCQADQMSNEQCAVSIYIFSI